MGASIKSIDHKGIEYDSFTEMCEAYGLNAPCVNRRLNVGMSLEEALTTPIASTKPKDTKPKKDRSVTDHKGNTFRNFTKMCEHYNKSVSCVIRRLQKGNSLEKALTEPDKRARKGTQCMDHLGNVYPSLSAMYKHYNTNSTDVNYRIKKKGMTLEQALTAPKEKLPTGAIECVDHLGNKFKSKVEMCDYWRIPRTVFFRRIRDGYTLEDALTLPIKSNMKAKGVIDHEGTWYHNVDMMCAAWNISKKQYMINIKNNCDIKEALTTITEPGKIIDHLGNEYESLNALCRAYNTHKSAIRSRIELGWALKQILENPDKIAHGIKIKDHKGQEFNSLIELANHYNVSVATFKRRRDVLGLPLEICLQPESIHYVKCTDHLGNKFDTLQDMLLYWNQLTGTYHARRDRFKLSTKECLTKIASSRYTKFLPDVEIKKYIDSIDDKDYYEVVYENNHQIWSFDMLIKHYRDLNPKVYKLVKNEK